MSLSVTGGVEGRAWHPGFEATHRVASIVLLAGLLIFAVARPDLLAGERGLAALLVAGAVVGIPHGASDFYVGWRVFARRLGSAWLGIFVLGYLGLAACVWLAWRVSPVQTFCAFVVYSAVHFASGDAGEESVAPSTWLARALTPLIPILLLHAAEVAPVVGLMTDLSNETVVRVAGAAAPWLVAPWAAIVAYAVVRECRLERRVSVAAVELALLAVAACVLPAYVTFAVYFCAIHAVRHLACLATRVEPERSGHALAFTAAFVLPAAALCFVALAFASERIVGTMSAPAVLAEALRIVAALTVPHMLLDMLAGERVAMRSSRTVRGLRGGT